MSNILSKTYFRVGERRFLIKKATTYPYNILFASLLTVIAVFGLLKESHRTTVVFQNVTGEKIVALTVDDGPDPLYTPQILDILRKYNVPATFFVVGRQVELYPDIFSREIAFGHEVGNHSYSHNHLPGMPYREIVAEIKRTNGIISHFSGKNVKWFRPPRGAYNRNVVDAAARCALKTVLWTKALETSKDKDPEHMARRLINGIRPGGIILLHDGRLDRTKTIKSLPLVIEGLHKKGYRFVTLTELLEQNSGVSI